MLQLQKIEPSASFSSFDGKCAELLKHDLLARYEPASYLRQGHVNCKLHEFTSRFEVVLLPGGAEASIWSPRYSMSSALVIKNPPYCSCFGMPLNRWLGKEEALL